MRRSRAALKTRAAELLAPDAPADKMVGSKLQTLGWYAKNQPDVAFYIRGLKRAALDRATTALRARREAEKAD